MLLAGDEFGRTQQGNNNAYCQDNEISWIDWSLLPQHRGLHRLVRGLIALRLAHPALRVDVRLDGRPYHKGLSRSVSFHGIAQNTPDWSHLSHSLAMRLSGVDDDADFYLISNAYTEPLAFDLPADARWLRLVDTSLPSPDDYTDEQHAPMAGTPYVAAPRSTVLLVAEIS